VALTSRGGDPEPTGTTIGNDVPFVQGEWPVSRHSDRGHSFDTRTRLLVPDLIARTLLSRVLHSRALRSRAPSAPTLVSPTLVKGPTLGET
jgi:hypothetical protein